MIHPTVNAVESVVMALAITTGAQVMIVRLWRRYQNRRFLAGIQEIASGKAVMSSVRVEIPRGSPDTGKQIRFYSRLIEDAGLVAYVSLPSDATSPVVISSGTPEGREWLKQWQKTALGDTRGAILPPPDGPATDDSPGTHT